MAHKLEGIGKVRIKCYSCILFLVNMGYIKTKPQPQGLYNYKSGYKIDQRGLVSAVGTTSQVECLEYKNLAD